jgi:hypothetical protein
VGTGGVVDVYNNTGTVNVDVDVDGYYTGVGGTGSAFTALATPVRVADTRTASLVGTETPITAATSESFSLATTASGIPTTATSVAANVTVVAGAAPGYLSVYPAPAMTTQPDFSDVNWVANDIVPNFTIADTNGTGSAEVYNSHGDTVNIVADDFGYFTTLASGPIMVAAAVTDTSIAITYNEAVTCGTVSSTIPFTYDWTGTASGITSVSSCTGGGATATPDVLTLNGSFILPASTGGTITYTVPSSTTDAVYSTSGTVYEAAQTLAVSAAVAPAMVSAYTAAGALNIVYNEDVTCPTTATAPPFAYNYTGDAPGFSVTSGTLVVTATCSLNVLTLTPSGTGAATAAPSTGANITYTVPTTDSLAASVSARGSVPALYEATQTLTTFTYPAMVSAVVSPSSIAITYNEAVSCATAAYSDFVYDAAAATSGGTIATASCSGSVVTLDPAASTTFVVPGTGASIVYTEPTTDSNAVSVFATSDFPQYAQTQTLALAATVAPTMRGTTTNAAGAQLEITYSGPVACPATGADSDFVYDSGFGILGGSISGCTAGTGDTLVLSGLFNAPTGSGTIVYTAPAESTTSNAVYAAGSVSAFAVTQTVVL